MPDALPVAPTAWRWRDYQDEPIASSSRRQKDPQASPVAQPRTHILIPFAGEATEQETSNKTNGAHEECKRQQGPSPGQRKGRDRRVSRRCACIYGGAFPHTTRKTHGVSGDFLPKREEAEREPEPPFGVEALIAIV